MTLSNGFSKVRHNLPARSQEDPEPVGSARDLMTKCVRGETRFDPEMSQQHSSQEDTSYLLTFRGLQGAYLLLTRRTDCQYRRNPALPAQRNPSPPLQCAQARAGQVSNSLTRSWVVPILGAAVGSGVGWANASQYTPAVLARRVEETRLDADRVRRDDFHLIGAFVGAVAFPALFRASLLTKVRSAGLFNGVLGGAGIGGEFGIGAFYYRDYAGLDSPVPAEQ